MKRISMKRAMTLMFTLMFLLAAFFGMPVSARAENSQSKELMVGNPNPTKGDFFADMFGTNGADLDVRTLIHGYNLINWDQSQGTYVVDPSVVYSYMTQTDDQGNKTYQFKLWDDLCYSDGSKITALDYAFSLLLQMSPEIEEIGGKIYLAEHILGNEAFLKGKSKVLKGVRVINDQELSITLDHAYLPHFYEEGLLLCVPYPISVIAPGCKVYDDGEGAYIGNEDGVGENGFTADLLKKTILDPETGYNSHPSVTSGAYVLTSYDGITCHLAINPYFKGVWLNDRSLADLDQDHLVKIVDGNGNEQMLVKPSIEKIGYTYVKGDEIQNKFKSGELHLVNKVVDGSVIDSMLQMEQVKNSSYPRVGLSFLTFSCEMPAVREQAVRQAIAWCIDRDKITADYCGSYGVRMDGFYGLQQWEYLMTEGKIGYPLLKGYDSEDGPAAADDGSSRFANRYARDEQEYMQMLAEWRALSLKDLTAYNVDVKIANNLLNNAYWTLNQNGGTYRAGTDEVRCKRVDGELVALDLKLMYLEGSRIGDIIQASAVDSLNACGIKLTLVPVSAQELLSSYYRQTERTAEMIYLATNFNTVYDPAISLSTDTSANHELWNTMYTDDKVLYRLAVDMRKTEPGDVYTYLSKWITFQERYNKVLPAIPVYSNTYYDFYVPELQNYQVTAHGTWAQAILESYLKINP